MGCPCMRRARITVEAPKPFSWHLLRSATVKRIQQRACYFNNIASSQVIRNENANSAGHFDTMQIFATFPPSIIQEQHKEKHHGINRSLASDPALVGLRVRGEFHPAHHLALAQE